MFQPVQDYQDKKGEAVPVPFYLFRGREAQAVVHQPYLQVEEPGLAPEHL